MLGEFKLNLHQTVYFNQIDEPEWNACARIDEIWKQLIDRGRYISWHLHRILSTGKFAGV